MPCTGSTSMPGMLRAARRKLSSIAAPSMISALVRPRLLKRSASALVFGSAALASAMHDQLLALGLAGQRVLERERPHLLRQVVLVAAHDRPEGLAAAAELRRRLVAVTGAGRCPSACTSSCWSWRISPRVLVLCVPAWRLDSCQRTMRCRMSARGSRPKISSGSVIESGRVAVEGGDLDDPSLGLLRLGGRERRRSRRRRRCLRKAPGVGTPSGSGRLTASRTRIQPPLAPGTAPSTMIRPRRTSVLTIFRFWVVTRVVAHVAGHLLALEHLAGVLALAGRTVGAMRHRVAVGGAAAAEMVALDDALKALAVRRAGHVDELADDEVVGGELGADVDQVLRADTRNSAIFRFGSTEAAAKWPRSARGVFFTLRRPTPS